MLSKDRAGREAIAERRGGVVANGQGRRKQLIVGLKSLFPALGMAASTGPAGTFSGSSGIALILAAAALDRDT